MISRISNVISHETEIYDNTQVNETRVINLLEINLLENFNFL